jgi:hypothetical protein
MRITDINDDARLQALNPPKALRRARKPVAPAEAPLGVQAIDEERDHEARKHEDRRLAQRRREPDQTQTAQAEQDDEETGGQGSVNPLANPLPDTLLDTRERHERRTQLRRKDDREAQQNRPSRRGQGIDVLA